MLICYISKHQVCEIFPDVLVWKSHNIAVFPFMFFFPTNSLLIQQARLSIVINNNSISVPNYAFNKSYTNLIRVCSERTVLENTADCLGHFFSYCSLWLIVVCGWNIWLSGWVIRDWCKLGMSEEQSSSADAKGSRGDEIFLQFIAVFWQTSIFESI